jgi:hypothetical protein
MEVFVRPEKESGLLLKMIDKNHRGGSKSYPL